MHSLRDESVRWIVSTDKYVIQSAICPLKEKNWVAGGSKNRSNVYLSGGFCKEVPCELPLIDYLKSVVVEVWKKLLFNLFLSAFCLRI